MRSTPTLANDLLLDLALLFIASITWLFRRAIRQPKPFSQIHQALQSFAGY
ncbi:hypothetical protein KQI63_15730 [bacterium]|nr:hypothetical protein [bacterium]